MTHADRESPVHCGRCGHRHALAAWQKLAPVQTLEALAVNAHVVAWPSDRRVEVRACASCGQHMARSRENASVSGAAAVPEATARSPGRPT